MNKDRLAYLRDILRAERVIYEGPPMDRFTIYAEGRISELDKSSVIGTVNFIEFMDKLFPPPEEDE